MSIAVETKRLGSIKWSLALKLHSGGFMDIALVMQHYESDCKIKSNYKYSKAHSSPNFVLIWMRNNSN